MWSGRYHQGQNARTPWNSGPSCARLLRKDLCLLPRVQSRDESSGDNEGDWTRGRGSRRPHSDLGFSWLCGRGWGSVLFSGARSSPPSPHWRGARGRSGNRQELPLRGSPEVPTEVVEPRPSPLIPSARLLSRSVRPGHSSIFQETIRSADMKDESESGNGKEFPGTAKRRRTESENRSEHRDS